MTRENLEELITLSIEFGMSKENAFLMAKTIVNNAHSTCLKHIDKHFYKVNAMEQAEKLTEEIRQSHAEVEYPQPHA